MNNIGERVKHIRKKSNLTQQEFSKSVNISQGRLSEIEKNICKPSADTLIYISKNFNVNLNWILLGDGEPFKS